MAARALVTIDRIMGPEQMDPTIVPTLGLTIARTADLTIARTFHGLGLRTARTKTVRMT